MLAPRSARPSAPVSFFVAALTVASLAKAPSADAGEKKSDVVEVAQTTAGTEGQSRGGSATAEQDRDADTLGVSDAAESQRDADIFGASDAAESDRDADIFGAGDSDEGGAQDSGASRVDSQEKREDAMFSDDSGASQGLESALSASIDERDNSIVLGGFLYTRLDYARAEQMDLVKARISSPNLLDIFIDARPVERVRAYARGRLRYDFTVNQSSEPSLLPTGERLSADLDQLWLKFDVGKRLFVTLGKQPVRWGTGRLWNPTDFLNSQTRDPFALFDDRTGLGLLKLHLPIESLGWNFYAIANFDGAEDFDSVGGALRAEILMGATEVSLSVAGRTDRPLQLGLDISSALGPFDVRAEAGLQRGVDTTFFRGGFDLDDLDVADLNLPTPFSREDQWILQAVAAIEYSFVYNDNDIGVIGGEYFYNQAGYKHSRAYLATFAAGTYRPLYMGRHYASVYSFWPSPGSWQDTSFLLTALANLSDKSGFARLDYNVTVLTLLRLNVYGSIHFGDIGELRYGVDPVDEDVLTLAELGGLPADALAILRAGIPAPQFEIGVSARVTF